MSDEKYAAKKHHLSHVFESIPDNKWDKSRIPDVDELLKYQGPTHSGLMSHEDKIKLDG